ncbi:MAG: anti-sigma factor family protein [Chloroflexota bacterium]
MFDFLRNITKSAEEKRQERLNAYLDNALSAQERRRFEQELEQDAGLRAELEALRWVKLSVQQVPRVRAPRNFVLDPAVYGQKKSQRQGALSGFYPGLRVATALTAFFFMLALALDLATPYGALNRPLLGTGASQVAMEDSSREGDVAMVAEEELESAPAAADEAPAADEEPAEEPEPEISAFAITEEPAVGEVAEEAAEESMEEEAITATQPQEEETEEEAAQEEAAQEEAAQEQPEAETPVEPGVGGATTSDERTAESTEAADGDALPPRGTPAPPSPELLATEDHTPTAGTVTPTVEDTASPESQVATRTATQFPYLLVIEIILGAALAGLVIVMLILRRGG